MIALGNFLIAIAGILNSFIFIFYILLLAHVVLSWVSPDPRNPIVQFIYAATEPVLSRVRSRIPPFGMIDVSPIVLFIALYFIDAFVVNSLRGYGQQFLRESGAMYVG